VPEEVPDNVVIEQEQAIDFDASLDLSASLDTTMGPPAVADERETSPVNPEDEIFVVVEQQPELIGGMAALRRAVNYPTFAQKTGLQGRVFVEFVVDETGAVQSPRIVRGVHKLLDTEALRVVQKMRFRPGRQRDVPVKVRMTLPVYFRLLDARAAN
jgi:protein TonB